MNKELSFKKLWKVFADAWWKLLLIMLAAMIAMGLFTQFFIQKKYSSSVTFYIINSNTASDYTTTSLLSATEQLANDYTGIILSDIFLKPMTEELKEEGWLLSLDPLLGSAQIPAYAPLKDGETVYGVRLFDTDFGKYFDGVNELPRDTVLCMRKMGVLAPKENSEEIYAATNHALRRLFAFTIPEGEGDLYS